MELRFHSMECSIPYSGNLVHTMESFFSILWNFQSTVWNNDSTVWNQAHSILWNNGARIPQYGIERFHTVEWFWSLFHSMEWVYSILRNTKYTVWNLIIPYSVIDITEYGIFGSTEACYSTTEVIRCLLFTKGPLNPCNKQNLHTWNTSRIH